MNEMTMHVNQEGSKKKKKKKKTKQKKKQTNKQKQKTKEKERKCRKKPVYATRGLGSKETVVLC